MEYIIAKIEPKSEDIKNRYYPQITGRECDIIHIERWRRGLLLIDVPYDPGNPHRFRTTTIREVRDLDDGTIVFETSNSVYTLIPTKKR